MSDSAAVSNEKPPETPVEHVIRVFGSARAGAIAGLTTWAVVKWNRPVSTGGGGGLVPAKFQMRYLRAAQAEDLPLRARDLIGEPRP